MKSDTESKPDRSEQLLVRVSLDEQAKLQAVADHHGKTKSAVVRDLFLGAHRRIATKGGR